MSTRVLCLLADGFEELETIAPVDVLRRAGVAVTLASLGELPVTGRNDIHLTADVRLSDELPDAYDLLLLPGGPGVAKLREDGRPAALARIFHESGKRVAAICAAPLVLKDAGILSGRRFTAHDSTLRDLPDAIVNERVVIEGNLITSRGAGTAVDFGLALVAELCGQERADEVASSIHAYL
ncbi:DJ-1/PfpI family protein [Luteolibacter ambystomatis]|uniref:DJ-1/PfpI family protein n=1 Tax=Luteolibacter ambystomatis TaxID=2824561 RepID=A0A975PG63_9BACT|nr:DJ-1 family glyoxalase III [Luteolibacter ambystomatis]QUE52479.1 DJ-1/PfpI family protein [Luteolibacter ambystomatis]